MQIKKAVITAAGFGTRFFPITKTIQKEMLPILNRPLIDYVVEDCIKAGIEDIVFIIKEGDTQIRDFYSESSSVKSYLSRMGKMDKYPELEKLHKQAKFTFVVQQPSDPYGTATPLRLAKESVINEDAFIMFMGDDFIFNQDGSSEASKMIKHFVNSNSKALATFTPKPRELLSKYGIARVRKKDGFDLLIDIVEKPPLGTEPSNLANISKYIFTPDIFSIFDKQELNEIHNELLITDTLTLFAKDNPVVAYATTGEYLDCGYLEGWLKANLTFASKDSDLLKSLKEFISEL